MKKIFIILLLTIATILPTFATCWVQTGEKCYIDTDTIEPFVDDSGNIVPNQYSFWIKCLNDGSQNIRNEEKRLNKKIWYMLCKEVIDINRKVRAAKTFAIYDLKDKPINSVEVPSVLMEWQSIVPNTVSAYEYEIIKEYAQQRR